MSTQRQAAGLACALVLLVWLGCTPAFADTIGVRSARLVATDEGYAVNADFRVELAPRLEEVLAAGVALHFVVECEVTRVRAWWLDERLASERQELRLSYQPLLRQYRLSRGPLHQAFPGLAEALEAMGQVSGWMVADRERVRAGSAHSVFLRMRLDTTQLPRPMQLTVVTTRDWTLASEWLRFNIDAAGVPAPVPGAGK